jgi:ATP-dependent DNA helicase RecG
VHQPHTDDNLDQLNNTTSHYHRRIVFDEFFLLQTMLALKKKGVALEQGISLAITDNELNTLIDGLPFGLTSAQVRVIHEIRLDMADGVPMHRLLQGDVGSGKTVISLIAACIAVQNGCQAAIMAPTEILAEQHYTTIKNLALARDLQIVMLTGKQPKAARTKSLAAISNGSAQIILGTHALIQEAVIFNRLGLVVVDEQHKFGVLQRARFKKKGGNPDILVMTATPIPRTLGLTVYGDLDVSIIDELPPGRTPVTTRLYNESRRQDVYELVSRTISNGNQAFIVYPLVDTSEKLDLRDATRMAAHLQQDIFPELRIALLHGRMDSAEKESVMQAFSAGHTHILVATTVIEVGIDVPNAALMIIEHAERFGLSQLHQLRGRVGRGAAESLCVLLAQFSRSNDARKRLRIMEQTNDGFKIAEEDFNIRGPGEFLGTRQSGLPDFRVAHIGRDIRILQEARSAAFDLVDQDPRLESPENQPFKNILAERWKGRLKLAGIG